MTNTTMTAGRRNPSSRRAALKCAASVLAVGCLTIASPASAQYATGGKGQYPSQILWFSWGAKGADVPNADLSKTNTYTVAGQTLQVTCELTKIAGTSTNYTYFDVYAPGDWKGDGLDNLYHIGGEGTANSMAIGLRNNENGTRSSGSISCNATYAGVPYQLEGLVFADAEATATGSINLTTGDITGEALGITLSNATKFRFIEQYSATCETDVGAPDAVEYRVSAIQNKADAAKTDYIFTAPLGNCEDNGTGPMGIGFIDGATEMDFFVKGGGSQAIALGVMTYIADLGDAPRTYGQPSHIPQFTWEGGEVSRGTSVNIFDSSFSLARPVQPLIRLGATVDVETIDAYSETAMNDDLRGVADDDSLSGPVRTPLLAVGDTYVLENVLCSASPGSAPVYGYIDFNRDGDFGDTRTPGAEILDEGERSELAMCSGVDSSVNLRWTVPSGTIGGDSYLRIRIGSVESQIASPDGVAIQGEVEDYPIHILTSQIKVVKDLVGRVHADDQFTVEVRHNDTLLTSATTTGSGGGTSTTATSTVVAAPQNTNLIISETHTGSGSLDNYSRDFSCVPGPENRVALGQSTYDSATRSWSVPTMQGNDIVCTVTNTGTAMVGASKTTIGGFGGPFTINSENLNGTFQPVTTTAAATATRATPELLAPVNALQAITLSETAVDRYDLTNAVCEDIHAAGTGNTAVISVLENGQVVIPPEALRPGARIVCNFTNSKQASIQLSKSLPRGRYVETDQFSLSISADGQIAASAVTTGTDSTATGTATLATAVLGKAYQLSEAAAPASSTDMSRYTTVWSCQNLSQISGAQTPSGTSASFNVTPVAGDELTCVLSNDRAGKSDLSIAKTNTIGGGVSDAADDFLLPNTTTTYTLTVTNHGPDSVTGAVVYDPAPEGPLTCPAVAAVICTGGGCPAAQQTVGQLQSDQGITLGTIALGEIVTLSYNCQVN